MVTVYRFYDNDDNLLYVGIANSVLHRISQHITTKEWFGAVVAATFEHFTTRAEAQARERHIIQDEKPRYNIHGKFTESISLTFAAEQHQHLKQIAAEQGCSIAELVRAAVAKKYPVPADEQGAA